jgi:hypothetical protein
MEAASSLWSIIPNVSVGVASICGLVYVVLKFLETLDRRAEKYESTMDERERAIRDVEAHVRNTLASALTQSTIALEQNSKVLGRVVRILDGDK